ncbi:protein kinase [Streptomyces phytohabitans]|uniref:protein kinase n=1 Tax=Streptomyces phytohabitans TaxID=1150371 RepID=UPI00345C0F34
MDDNADYAGRLLADRYRLPRLPADEFELAETRAYDTASGQEVLVRQVPLPEVVDAEVLDGGRPSGGVRPLPGAGYGRATRRPAEPGVRRAVEAALAASRIPDHPRLDQVFDVFVEGDGLWIVSELVPARPLVAVLAEEPLSPHRAAEIAADLLDALHAVHAHGWVHRNITARSVLVCDDGRALLTGMAVGAAEEALCGYDTLPEPGAGGAPAEPVAYGGGDAYGDDDAYGGDHGDGEVRAHADPDADPDPEPGGGTYGGGTYGGGDAYGEPSDRRGQARYAWGEGAYEPRGSAPDPGPHDGRPERLPRGPLPEGFSGVYAGPEAPGLDDPTGGPAPYGNGQQPPLSGTFAPGGDAGTGGHAAPAADDAQRAGIFGFEGADSGGGAAARAARRGAIAAYRAGTRAASARVEAEAQDRAARQRPALPEGGTSPDWWAGDGNGAEGTTYGDGGTYGNGGTYGDSGTYGEPGAYQDSGAYRQPVVYGPAGQPYGPAPVEQSPRDERDGTDPSPDAERWTGEGPTALPGSRHGTSRSVPVPRFPREQPTETPYEQQVSYEQEPYERASEPERRQGPVYRDQIPVGGAYADGGAESRAEAPGADGYGDAAYDPDPVHDDDRDGDDDRDDDRDGDGTYEPALQDDPDRYRGPATSLDAERARQARMTIVGAVTERWAPEQAGPVYENWRLAPPVGPAADLWALGVLLFRAVQGHAPYPEDDVVELVQMVCAEPPAYAEECGALRPVVESLMRQDPTERPEFEELRGWLRSLVRSAPEPEVGLRTLTAPPSLEPGRPSDPRRLPIKRRRGELVRRRRFWRRSTAAAAAPPAAAGATGSAGYAVEAPDVVEVPPEPRAPKARGKAKALRRSKEAKRAGRRSPVESAAPLSELLAEAPAPSYDPPRDEPYRHDAYGGAAYGDDPYRDDPPRDEARPRRAPRPRAPGGAGGPRRLGRLLVGGVLLLLTLAALYALWFMPDRGGDDEGQRRGAVGEQEPAPTGAPEQDGGSDGGSGDGSDGDAPADRSPQHSQPADLAKGFGLHKDPTGFQIGLPDGWSRTGPNDRGQVRFDSGEFEMVVVKGRDSTGEYGKDPLEYQADDERELAPFRASGWSSASSLRRIDVGDTAMAEGTYTWEDESGRSVYVRNRAMILGGRYHLVLVFGPEDEKKDVDRYFEGVVDTYRVLS